MKSAKFIFILLLIVMVILIQRPVFSQSKVFIPDANFRNFLNANYPTFMDLSGDSLNVDSAATFAGNFDCSNQNIADLTGIEFFAVIYMLEFNNNQLTSLPDLSAITTLMRLYCHDNQLTALPDFSDNTALVDIYCDNNELTSLPDFSSNTALLHLVCNNNQLTRIPDLSPNVSLLYLHVDNNQLSSLPDLSNNINLSELSCNNNQLTSLPDLSTNTALYDLACNSNNLTALPDLTANTALKRIYCHSNNLTSLPDLSNCTTLLSISCDYNQLTSLPDLSANANLHIIYCGSNQLSSLPDLSNNNDLQVFHCGFNKLDFSDARELRIADTLSELYNFSYTPQLPFGDAYSTCILEGDTVTLTIAAQDSALSYQWFKDNIAINGATDTILLIPDMAFADTGIYTCRSYGTALESPPMIWGPGISEFVSATVTVKINLPCGFSGLDTDYCLDDDTVILTGSPTGGIFSGPGIAGNLFVADMAGEGEHTITYSYIYPNNCEYSDLQNVVIHSLPAVIFTGMEGFYYIDDDSVLLTGNPPGGIFSGPGISGNYFSPYQAGAGSHVITYSYTDTNGCSNSNSQEVEIEQYGAIQQSGLISDLKIYPNPAKRLFNIEMNITQKQYIEIKILNNLGKEITRKELKNYSGSYITSFDLKDCPAGIYYLQISIDERKIIKKIIIE